MIITSSSNEKIKELKKLQDKKFRDQYNMFLIEGEHLVQEAYKSGNLIEVLLTEDMNIDIDVKKTYITEKIIKELSNLTSIPKIIGVCKKFDLKKELGNKIIMLDNIQDPGNLGAIIRSAVAFDVDTIILGNGSVDLYNQKVLRATQGLIFHLNIMESDLSTTINNLKKSNYPILGTKVDSGTELKSFYNLDKYAIIMGNEGKGMSEYLESLCDDFIYIKMNELCESLNVSVACSIILYEFNNK
jgi:TrmH family RNA methyltransferase